MAALQESSTNLPRLVFPRAAVPVDVGVRVRRARIARRWTQARLAARAGISRASVYRLEGRPGGPATLADTLFRIAHALDVPIREFVPTWPEWEPVKGFGLGDNVRKRRRELDMTLAELAKAIGVSESTLSRHERGVGESPTFVRRVGDDVVHCNDELSKALGLDG